MKTLLTSVVLLFGGLLANSARADFVYEPFDYPAGGLRGEELVQKSGGTGFQGSWQATNFSGTDNFYTSPGSLTFGNLAVAGNSVEAHATFNSVNSLVRTTLKSFVGSGIGTRFLSFLIRRDSTSGSFGGFGGLFIDGTADDLFIGKGGSSDNWGMERRGGGGAVLSDVPATVGSTALLVLKMESFNLGPEQFTLYVNPTPGQGEPGFGLLKSDLDIGTADKIGLFNSGAYTFDEIRIGDSFAAVTSTPEPSTILLSALGLSPLFASRLRKKFLARRQR